MGGELAVNRTPEVVLDGEFVEKPAGFGPLIAWTNSIAVQAARSRAYVDSERLPELPA